MAQQPNLNKMMKQLQDMQADMAQAQEKLKDEIVEASAGGGMVGVKISCDLQVKSIEIDPSAVDPEDVEILQDMVTAAVNEALRTAQQVAEQRLGAVTGPMQQGLGAMGLPGM
ncbi:MAG: YbaB/EbfC family nucleoid-associated protein [Thermoleophilaceae bacterium]|nr:YbaB/EbfC family nucleoid-associated protein [Thermoleophilaceae bacterium]